MKFLIKFRPTQYLDQWTLQAFHYVNPETPYEWEYLHVHIYVYRQNLILKPVGLDTRLFVRASMSNHHLVLPEFYCLFIRVIPTHDYCEEADRNADYLALEMLFCMYRIKYRFYEHHFLNT